MRKLFVFGALAAGLAGAAPAAAQGLPLGVEVRGGAAFPMGDLSDQLGAGTGVSYGVNATLQATPMLGVYAGYERAEFGADDAGAGGSDLTDEGFAFGGKLALPFGGMMGLGPWIRAGALYNELSRENDFQVGDDGGRKFGFEVGGGVSIPLGMIVSVTPGVRYRTYSAGSMGLGGSDLNVSYIVADLGLSFGF